MKQSYTLQWVASLVLLSVLLVTSCSMNGIRVDHVNTEPKGQVEDHTNKSKEVPAKKVEPKYPDKRDWPAKWDQWHRYSQAVHCELKAEYTECEYYLCGDGIFSDPAYAGSHMNRKKKLFNRYYYTHCYTTEREQHQDQKSASVKNQQTVIR